jgi:Helix-turn-helix domain
MGDADSTTPPPTSTAAPTAAAAAAAANAVPAAAAREAVASDSARLDALEERVERLERGLSGYGERHDPAGDVIATDPFWALSALKARLPEGRGAVVFTGVVPQPTGAVEWQWGTGTDQLLDTDWSELSATIAALGHPVRLLLLRRVLGGASSVAELQAHEGLGTSGQLYHHLRQLVGAGWLRATARGHYAVPPERMVPLLAILSAAQR